MGKVTCSRFAASIGASRLNRPNQVLKHRSETRDGAKRICVRLLQLSDDPQELMLSIGFFSRNPNGSLEPDTVLPKARSDAANSAKPQTTLQYLVQGAR